MHLSCSVAARRAAILVLCGLLGACGKPDYHTIDGQSGRFADFRDRWILVNYWAEWCKPCIAELPELNRFAQEFGDRAQVFAVNFDGLEGTELQQQVERLNIAVPVLVEDPAGRFGYQRPQALPTTFVIGPDGQVKKVLQGEQTVATLRAAIGAD